MSRPLRALLVEDSEDDALLIVRELERAGYDVSHRRVDIEATMRTALEENPWDVVICDYNLPGFSGSKALTLFRERDADTPFLFVSGTIGEDAAVAAMKAGANDYVMKGNLKRLPPAIARELEDADVRRRRRQAEEALIERTRWAELGADLGMSLVRGSELGAGLRGCAEAIVRHLGAAAAHIWMLDVRQKSFEVGAGAGLPPAVARECGNVTLGDATLGVIARDRRQVWAETTEPIRFVDSTWAKQAGVRGLALLPLAVDERVTGVLAVFAHRPWNDLGRQALEAIADQLAVGIERRRTEAELRRSEERFSQVFQTSPIGIAISALADGRLIDMNGAFSRIVGAGRELIGHPIDDLGLWPSSAGYPGILERLRRRDTVRDLDLQLRRRDRSLCPVLASFERFELGNEECILMLVHDASERVRLEQRLRQAQKMEAIGLLAGGVAHDFNNLLTIILGHCDLVAEELPAVDPHRVNLQEIQSAATSATRLTGQLLAFSRQQVLQLQVLDVNAVIGEIEPLLRRLIPASIELSTVLSKGTGTVVADRGQLDQVILNLAANARDAMPDGGRLTIETSTAEIDQDYIELHSAARTGLHVVLSVCDTGLGMDEETRSRVFEPFFTTKEMGRGTGMGLATVYGVVKQSGGFIWVYSEPGQGTVFKVYLPRSDAAQSIAPAQVTPLSLEGTETILLVEDADAVRSLLREGLRRRGYRVFEAADGREALRLVAESSLTPDLLVTDLVMPHLGGRDLARELKSRLPNLRILFTSGYTDDAVVRRGEIEPGSAFLQKPFTPEVLSRKVREVLHSGPVDVR